MRFFHGNRRFFRSAAAVCCGTGLLLSLAVIGVGVAFSIIEARKYGHRLARHKLEDLIALFLNATVSVPDIIRDEDIPSVSIAVNATGDISKQLGPIMSFMTQVSAIAGLSPPVMNDTSVLVSAVVNTPELMIPVDIMNLTWSVLSFVSSNINVLAKVNGFPKTAGDAAYYAVLAIGILLTTLVLGAILMTTCMTSGLLWLKGDIAALKDKIEEQPSTAPRP